MPSQAPFVNGQTLTDADWFNDLDRLHYTIFGDPANIAAVQALTAGWVYLGQAIASSSASVAFTSGISSTYDTYAIVTTDVFPATAGSSLMARVSQNAGATYFSGASDYMWNYSAQNDADAAADAGDTADTGLTMSGNNDDNGVLGYSGIAFFSKLSNTTTGKAFRGNAIYTAQTKTITRIDFSGAFVTNNLAVNAIEFLFSSGNIASGTFRLYGLRNS